jgi:PAS domain S-box-containing protein
MEVKTASYNGKPDPVKQLQEKPDGFLIVGIGASAGGIQALQEFFRNVPADSGMAYVVILHLSPDHDSQLAQVLQYHADIPVEKVTEKTAIKPNHVYVVPPDRHLTIEENFIAVAPNLNMEERRAPVDIFFRTLADHHGPRAISVVLSGTGANGSMGLKRIKERGGATYVQNPREAEFNEMPRNAIATELVDEVLNVGEIPRRIIAYRNGIGAVEIVEEQEKRPEPQQHALREIFTQLRLRTGHDFSNYKRATLLRRIERRINVHNLPDLPAYMSFLQEQPDETHALLKDLLISVTNFFRDEKAFNYLEHHVLPQIFAGKNSADQVRIWVAGCATGEEAYSIAMLCAEQVLGTLDAPKVQIFATDIDEAAIATGREGVYTLNDAADVPPERLRRFFTRDGDLFRVRREIREMVLFANHNFLKDPPFSKLDLVTCRNVLIYLNSTAQERVIETFHFALKPKKFLFLGTSESVDGANDLYAVYNRDFHVYQTREVVPRSYPVPESVPQFMLSKAELLQKSEDSDNQSQRISFGELHQRMLEQYAPPSVVVNQEYDVVHMTERAGKYFEFSGGEPTQNLLKLIKPQIRLELRSALYQAVQNRTAVEARNIKFNLNGQADVLDIHVRPVLNEADTARGYILVIFKPAKESAEIGATVMTSSDEPVARQLEEELIGLKNQLRNSIEQHEYQAEELKASNEELQAMNEELRSAAEELETSKEELQSINEELRTVNQELKVKIDETSLTSNNLQNLINSANVGTIFLDRYFAIRLFTPAILDIFNLKSGDYGRPITDITNKLEYSNLVEDAQMVLEKLTLVEREVTTSDKRYYLMRLLPYRTADDRINGVVITFFDITRRKESEEALRQSEENYRLQLEEEVEKRTVELSESKERYLTLVENIPDVITRWNKELKLVFANTAFKRKAWIVHNPPDSERDDANQAIEYDPLYMESLQKAFDTGDTVEYFSSSPTADGEAHFYSRLTPERNASGQVETVLAIARDITDIRKAEQESKKNQEILQATLDSSVNMIQVFKAVRDEQGKIIDFTWVVNNATSEKFYGAVQGESLLKRNPGILDTGIFDHFVEVTETGVPQQYEKHYTFEQFNGWVHQSVVKLDDGVATSTLDITDRKLAEVDVRKSEERLRMFVTASSDLIYQMTADWTSMFAVHGSNYLTKLEAPGEKWMKRLIPAEEQQKVRSAIDLAIKNKHVFELEHRIILADGHLGWANSKAVPLLDDAGNILEWFGIASDITVRKTYEQERDQSYLMLSQSELVAGAGTWDYDLLTGSFNWSDGMYRLFNLEKGTAIRPEIYVKYATEDSKDKAIRVASYIENGDVEFEETLTINVGGSLKVLKMKATLIANEHGQTVRVLGVDMDVTATVEAEKRLREMAASQQLEIFRVTLRTQEEERRRISESLHNGLGQILFATRISMNHLSKEKAVSDPEKFEKSKDYTEHLLTRAIWESRNISHELMPTTLDTFGLRSAIDDVCKQLSDSIQFKCEYNGVEMRLEKYLELAIYRTVQELMLNVVKHAEATSAEVQVNINSDEIQIRVSDNGRGMKEALYTESGIGLSSISSKIKLLSGTVDIKSVPGNGTDVIVHIPIGKN